MSNNENANGSDDKYININAIKGGNEKMSPEITPSDNFSDKTVALLDKAYP